MIWEINKLMDSEYKLCRELGRLLYSRESQDSGLTYEELERLLEIVNQSSLDKLYNEGYEVGFEDGDPYK